MIFREIGTPFFIPITTAFCCLVSLGEQVQDRDCFHWYHSFYWYLMEGIFEREENVDRHSWKWSTSGFGMKKWRIGEVTGPAARSWWRGVGDFRALNEATMTHAHPLPRIKDILVLVENLGCKVSVLNVFVLKVQC